MHLWHAWKRATETVRRYLIAPSQRPGLCMIVGVGLILGGGFGGLEAREAREAREGNAADPPSAHSG